MDSSSQIEDTAADWLVRRDAEGWSDADEIALEEWLGTSTAHEVAFLRLEAAWEEAQRLKALGAGMRPGAVPPPGQWQVSPLFESHQPVPPSGDEHESDRVTEGAGDEASRGPAGWRPGARAVAAILTLSVATATWFWLRAPGDDYSTPVGGLTSVPLRDGSNITLNTASKIRVDLTRSARQVELQTGEAFFEVAKDPNRPFTVTAGDKRVIVVGTKFSVRRDHDDVQVVVTEGAVRLEGSSAPMLVNGAAEDSAVLPAGAVAEAKSSQVKVENRASRELDEKLSWRTGYLIFDGEPLSRAIAEFNRYTARKIVIEDPQVGALSISGRFRATNSAAFTRMLHEGFGINARERDDSVILSR